MWSMWAWLPRMATGVSPAWSRAASSSRSNWAAVMGFSRSGETSRQSGRSAGSKWCFKGESIAAPFPPLLSYICHKPGKLLQVGQKNKSQFYAAFPDEGFFCPQSGKVQKLEISRLFWLRLPRASVPERPEPPDSPGYPAAAADL